MPDRRRVFVAFIDQRYFQRWYCLREWLLARAPFDELSRRDPYAAGRALEHIVVAIGAESGDRVLEHLPPLLRSTDWPASDATGTLTALAWRKLEVVADTLAARCDASGVPAVRRSTMVDEAAMPLPENLAGVPLYPRMLPSSLGSRFVGRVDDIWRLHAALMEPRLDSPHIAALTGALQGGGGLGKTQLALEYRAARSSPGARHTRDTPAVGRRGWSHAACPTNTARNTLLARDRIRCANPLHLGDGARHLVGHLPPGGVPQHVQIQLPHRLLRQLTSDNSGDENCSGP